MAILPVPAHNMAALNVLKIKARILFLFTFFSLSIFQRKTKRKSFFDVHPACQKNFFVFRFNFLRTTIAL